VATAVAIDESRNGKPSGIQLVQVEGFLEVARRGSVSRAAEALFITQPTLTARLHGLEKELGTPLFLRTPHGMRLTDAGRAWIPFAERARVEVSVRTGHSEDVVDLVVRDEVQLGLGRTIRHPDLELRPFHTEELVLVCAPDHPFTKRKDVAMAEVAVQKLIMFDRTSSYYEITQGAFLSAGVKLRGLMELDSIEAAKKMVERGLGVALLPGTAVAREVEGGTLSVVAMQDAPPMHNSIVVFRRRDAGEPAGIVAAFLELLGTRG
jgi:DNA-binding transcriptional LysR family regulator